MCYNHREGFVRNKVNLMEELRHSVFGHFCQILDGLKLKFGEWKDRLVVIIMIKSSVYSWLLLTKDN